MAAEIDLGQARPLTSERRLGFQQPNVRHFLDKIGNLKDNLLDSFKQRESTVTASAEPIADIIVLEEPKEVTAFRSQTVDMQRYQKGRIMSLLLKGADADQISIDNHQLHFSSEFIANHSVAAQLEGIGMGKTAEGKYRKAINAATQEKAMEASRPRPKLARRWDDVQFIHAVGIGLVLAASTLGIAKATEILFNNDYRLVAASQITMPDQSHFLSRTESVLPPNVTIERRATAPAISSGVLGNFDAYSSMRPAPQPEEPAVRKIEQIQNDQAKTRLENSKILQTAINDQIAIVTVKYLKHGGLGYDERSARIEVEQEFHRVIIQVGNLSDNQTAELAILRITEAVKRVTGI